MHASGASELVGRADRLGHDDLGRLGGAADRPDERLQVRVGHELLEVVDALPFVDDQDVPVADAEPVVQAADGLGLLGDLRELVGPVHQGLLELGRVALELTDDQHTHVEIPPWRPRRRRRISGWYTSPGRRADHSGSGRWTMTGTNTGPFDLFGLPPTGRPVTMTGQEIF